MKRFLEYAKHIFTNENIAVDVVKSGITNDQELEVIHEYAAFLQGKDLQSISVIYPLTEYDQVLVYNIISICFFRANQSDHIPDNIYYRQMWTSFIKKVNSQTALFQFAKLDKGNFIIRTLIIYIFQRVPDS